MIMNCSSDNLRSKLLKEENLNWKRAVNLTKMEEETGKNVEVLKGEATEQFAYRAGSRERT